MTMHHCAIDPCPVCAIESRQDFVTDSLWSGDERELRRIVQRLQVLRKQSALDVEAAQVASPTRGAKRPTPLKALSAMTRRRVSHPGDGERLPQLLRSGRPKTTKIVASQVAGRDRARRVSLLLARDTRAAGRQDSGPSQVHPKPHRCGPGATPARRVTAWPSCGSRTPKLSRTPWPRPRVKRRWRTCRTSATRGGPHLLGRGRAVRVSAGARGHLRGARFHS